MVATGASSAGRRRVVALAGGGPPAAQGHGIADGYTFDGARGARTQALDGRRDLAGRCFADSGRCSPAARHAVRHRHARGDRRHRGPRRIRKHAGRGSETQPSVAGASGNRRHHRPVEGRPHRSSGLRGSGLRAVSPNARLRRGAHVSGLHGPSAHPRAGHQSRPGDLGGDARLRERGRRVQGADCDQ